MDEEHDTQATAGRRRPVVIGFDGSRDAVRALTWAVHWAHACGLPLRVVVARGDLYSLSVWADEWTRGLAQEWLDQARKVLAETGTPADEEAILDGNAVEALLEESRAAEVVVVGGHGTAPLMGALQGSVSQHVTRHASCPVVVVHGRAGAGGRGVAVGVDGSPGSLQALEFALTAAAASGQPVRVVIATEHGRFPGGGDVIPALAAARAEQDQATMREAERILARHPEVEAEVHVTHASPIHTLLVESRSADLLVVGSRGRGAFAGLLLGSVSGEVLRHAECAVAVVR